MPMRLHESELIKTDHFPAITFLNAISDSDFLRTVENMSNGIGTGINAAVCLFPGDLDPGEEVFEGVMFSLHDEEIIIDHNTFYIYLRKACERYTKDFPTDKNKIEELLKVIATNYSLS